MPVETLEQQANERLKDARKWKEQWALDIKEAYLMTAPHRMRQILSTTKPPRARAQDAAEVNTDLGMLMCGDFVTEIVNTYMPEAQLWCERRAGIGVPDDVFAQVAEQVKKDDKLIFSAMKASNLYSEIPKAFNPDLVIGTCAVWIEHRSVVRGITVTAIPIRELEINIGPDGQIDDRWAIRYVRNCYVRAVLGKEIAAKLTEEQSKEIDAKSNDYTEVRWGFWRDWDDESDEVWQHVVMLKDKLLHDVQIRGEGCCPLGVIRFNPSVDWPWGIGPTIQGMPTFRQVDEWERQIPEACERAVNSAIVFPDDSFAQIEQGIEPGMGYPIRSGTEGAVKAIYEQPSIQPELVDLERKEHRLRKLHYVDFPEQSGDTPPTLGQWLDEMARAQRRIGTPGQSFFREGPRWIFLRFKYLLEKLQAIKPLTAKGTGNLISTQPYNPAQRAAEQQEIATATQTLQICAGTFPEEFKVWIDGKMTMENFIGKMRSGGLITVRNEADVKKALANITPLLKGKMGDVPVPAGAGAPGPT